MAQVSANHHYVPKAILRQFCFRGETLWYFSRNAEEEGVRPKNINSVFKKRHLNTYHHDDGTKDDSLEKWFASEFDDVIVSVIKKIEAGLTGSWTAHNGINKQFMTQFIYNHIKRTPDFYREVDLEQKLIEITNTKMSEIAPILHDQGLHFTFEDLFPSSERDKHLSNIMVTTLARQSERVLEALWRLRLVFAVPVAKNSSFIIGSSPVVRLTNDGNQSLEDGDVELWTPLAPRIAVGLVRAREEGEVILLNQLHARKLNEQIAKKSISVASRSDRLLNSLLGLGT